MAGTEKAQIVIDTSVDQKGLKDGLKKSENFIKGFSKGVVQELLGIDQKLFATAGLGPIALGKAFVDMGAKAVAALNEMAAQYREQEKAEISLQNAAKNNPYLNDRSVKQLKAFADEMQKTTGIDNVQILQTETNLANLGRNQEQIQKIVKTAADMAAAGIMSYDEAVNELNDSYNGVIRTSGTLYPELKNLSKEALASGEAIDIIAGKVAGSAAEAMKSGAGSVQAYQNAIGDLKKSIGQDWEEATKGFRVAFTGYINKVVEAKEKSRELKEAIDKLATGDTEAASVVQSDKVDKLKKDLDNVYKLVKNWGNTTEEIERRLLRVSEDVENANSAFAYNTLREIEELKRLIKEEEEIAAKLNSRLKIEQEIDIIVGRASAARAKAETQKAIEAENTALGNQILIRRLLNEGKQEEARLVLAAAEAAAKAAETEAKRVEDQARAQEEIENSREKYAQALKKANAEILKDAYLKNEISEEEFKRLLNINNTSKDTGALFKEQISSISLQNKLLDSQISAYKGLLDASNGLLDGTLNYEQAIEKAIKAVVEQAETDKRNDEDRKKRLAELVKEQEDAQKKLIEILKDAQGDARILEEERIQRYISDLRLKNAKQGIEAQYAHEVRLLLDLQKEKIDLINENQNAALYAQAELEEEAIRGAKGNEALITQIKEQGEKDRAEIISNYSNSIDQVMANSAEREIEIERQKTEAIRQMHLELYKDILSKAQEHINALGSIANSISTIWTNNVDRETEEKLKANKEMIQSDEERAAAEKKIMIEAAYEKYKIELFTWATNVTMAAAQAAMAVANAIATPPFPVGVAMAAIAAAMGAMQVAAVISARPKPPSFHTGGIVPGAKGSEVHTVQKAGEVDLTPGQFKNTMKAISNLAAGSGGGGTNLVVNVENNAANTVSTSQSLDTDGLRIVVEQITGNALSKGRLDDSLAMQNANANGAIIT